MLTHPTVSEFNSVIPSQWGPQKINRENDSLKCKSKVYYYAHNYKQVETLLAQQEEVPCPSRGHYLKAKNQKSYISRGWGDSFNLD